MPDSASSRPSGHSWRPATWPPSTWFIALGVAANAVLSLIDWARGSSTLWDAAPLILGSGPNVVAVPAIAFTALGLGLRPEFRAHFGRRPDRQIAWLLIVTAVIGLIIWEYVQRGSARLRFDRSDLAATLLGGLACGVVAARLLRRTTNADPTSPTVLS